MGILKAKGVVYKPVDEVDLGPDSDEFYLRANVKGGFTLSFSFAGVCLVASLWHAVLLRTHPQAPRMAGLFVKVFTWFLESPIFGGILLYFLKRNNLIHKLVSFAELQESPLFVPLHPYQGIIENEVKCLEPDMSPPEKVQQAVDCLQSLEDIPKSPQLSFQRWTILDYAKAYTSGETTPEMVADRFIASVHESLSQHLQMSFFINYNVEDILKQAKESTARHAQGSVRLPAALCGVVGLKPTFARVPHDGVLPINYTVGMVGILAATVEDALITYAAISGGLPSDHSGITVVLATLHVLCFTVKCPINKLSSASTCRFCGFEFLSMGFEHETTDTVRIVGGQSNTYPEIGLPLLKSANYMSSDFKMAISRKWFNDCSDDIRECCSNAVANYQRNTAGRNKAEVGWDVRVGLSVYSSFHSHEYLNAQRIRNRQLRFHEKIFSVADVIVTPTVGVTAYTIEDDALTTGELDYINGAALVRYQIAGNFLGLPAVTVPIGYDRSGLPIGLQFIGKPWSESLLIHIASALQALCKSGYKKPEVFFDMLAC
ncbi:UNVERIFIED_CONTAM: Fatty acid amide hydrolase [Sesamum angustifolium]|uniref:Fatty acid amide hydrolase n=1 Tax=Sesamum angustifolium TaxID=2727405 RepID=A0AAW2NHL8_9LAMI